VLGVAVGLVGLGVIGFLALRSRAAAEDAAAGKLAEASVYYWQGDYQRSLALARETAEQYGSTASGRDAHRQAADAAYWGGDFKTAAAEYRRYLATNPKGLLADAARRSLAYALESDGQFLEAVTEYELLELILFRAIPRRDVKPLAKALLKRFSLFGPPGIIFFDAQGREIKGLRVIGYQNAERFRKTLEYANNPL